MSGHTNGPWNWSSRYETSDGRSTWTLLGEGGYGILSCDGEGNSPQGMGDDANARLIAAAPELLEALIRLRDCYSTSHSPQTRQDCWEQAFSAIAKAKGEPHG